jgi:hypothetical protein
MNKLFKQSQTSFNEIQAFSVGFRLWLFKKNKKWSKKKSHGALFFI